MCMVVFQFVLGMLHFSTISEEFLHAFVICVVACATCIEHYNISPRSVSSAAHWTQSVGNQAKECCSATVLPCCYWRLPCWIRKDRSICSRFQNCVVKRITKALSTNPRRNRHTHHHCKTLHMFWPLIYWLGYTVADRGFPLRFRLATPVGSVLGITGLDIHPLL